MFILFSHVFIYYVFIVSFQGELCGGKYPHPDVTEVPYARPVQVGVWRLGVPRFEGISMWQGSWGVHLSPQKVPGCFIVRQVQPSDRVHCVWRGHFFWHETFLVLALQVGSLLAIAGLHYNIIKLTDFRNKYAEIVWNIWNSVKLDWCTQRKSCCFVHQSLFHEIEHYHEESCDTEWYRYTSIEDDGRTLKLEPMLISPFGERSRKSVAVYSTAQVTDFSKNINFQQCLCFLLEAEETAQLWFSAAPRSTCFASTSVFQVAAAACLVWSVGAKTAQHFFSTFRAIQDPKYTSLVPSMFALPPIAGNLAEGIVVKPWDCETLMDERPIFKIKIQEFQEGEGSAPPPGDPSMKSYLLSQINENRLAAAASKVGPLTDVRGWEECLWGSMMQQSSADVGPVDLAVWIILYICSPCIINQIVAVNVFLLVAEVQNTSSYWGKHAWSDWHVCAQDHQPGHWRHQRWNRQSA